MKEQRRFGGDWGGRRESVTPKRRRAACSEELMLMMRCAPGARAPGSTNSPLNRLV